jgi:hypothetical protein
MPSINRKSTSRISRDPVRAFISYSNRDRALLEQLVRHLSPLEKSGLLALDYDLSLKAGATWNEELPRLLTQAAIVLFLVSPDSLSSDFVAKELTLAVSQQQSKVIVPVLLRPCDWYNSPLARYMALPSGAKPVTTWENRDEAFADIASGVRRVVESLRGAEERVAIPESHRGRINEIATAPDGRQIVSAAADGLAIVWDAITLKPTGVLTGHNGEVLSIHVSSDGRNVATGSTDNTVRIWDIRTYRELKNLEGHTNEVTSVAFTEDGRRLVSGSRDGSTKVWDSENGQILHSIERGGLSRGGRSIGVVMLPATWRVAIYDLNEVTLWDLSTLTKEGAFPSEGADGLCAMPDGARVIMWHSSGFEIRSVENGQIMSQITAPAVNVLRVLRNGRHAVSAHPEGLKLWDLTNGTMIRSVNLGRENATALAITPDGARAIWGSERGGIYSWPIDLSVSRAVPVGHDRLRLAYLAVLESPELWRILETWDESALAGIGAQVGCPPDQDVLEMLAARHPNASPPALWVAWMETLHKTKLGKSSEAS